jgi:tagatose 1,6-diphosphate aldolase
MPPVDLSNARARLRFDRIEPADEEKGLSPYYHFRIFTAEGSEAGHINFRIGDSEHILSCAGHIGFRIEETCRGRGLAGQACLALAHFVRQFYEAVILTANPDNAASIRVIEKLGAEYLGTVSAPPHDPGYAGGARQKRRYVWKLPDGAG